MGIMLMILYFFMEYLYTCCTKPKIEDTFVIYMDIFVSSVLHTLIPLGVSFRQVIVRNSLMFVLDFGVTTQLENYYSNNPNILHFPCFISFICRLLNILYCYCVKGSNPFVTSNVVRNDLYDNTDEKNSRDLINIYF